MSRETTTKNRDAASKGARAPGRLIFGDVTRGLPDALRATVVGWVRDNPLAPGVVLVGSNLLALSMRRWLALGDASSAGTPHVGLRFVTFVDLARALAAPRVAGRAPLPPGGRALIAGALGAESVGYFAPVSVRPGFHRRLSEVFKDLDDAGFADGAAARGTEWERRAARGSAGGAKIGEVLRMYANYRALIDADFITTSDLIRLAALEASRFATALGSNRLAVYGFYDFTEVQRRLLAALAGAARLVAFSPDPELPGHAFAHEAATFLSGLGLATERARAPVESPLDQLRDRLFAPVRDVAARDATAPGSSTPNPSASDARLDVVSAPGEVEEAREIARTILRATRDDGVPFREMAVLLRSSDSYAPLLREALDDAEIPFSLDRGLPLSETRTGRAFHFLLGLAGTELHRADVIEFLSVAPLSPETVAGADVSPTLWDLVTKRAGIVASRGEWSDRLRRFARSDAAALEKRAASTLEALVGALFTGIEALPRSGSWTAYSDAARGLLRGWLAPSPDRDDLDALLAELAANDRLRLPPRGDSRATLDEFRAAVLEAMAARAKRIGAFGIDSVTVTDLLRARGLRFRLVIVPGLVERGFPSPPTQDPILLDRDREALNALGAGRLALRRARPREEELLFALALAAATERVVLTFPRFETGTTRERTASPFILRAGEALLGRRLRFDTIGELPGFRHVPLSSAGAADPDDALTASERRVGAALRVPAADRRVLAGALAAGHAGFARALALWDARWGSAALNAHTGVLPARAVRRIARARADRDPALSPSVMETYAICPLRSYFKDVLDLEQVREPEAIEEIEASDLGRLLHRILERLMSALVADGLVPLSPARLEDARARLRAIAAEEFRAAEERGLTGFPLLWRIRQRRLLAALREFLEREAEPHDDGPPLLPLRLEAEFGTEGLAEARVVLANGRGLRFRGVIDRIDATPDASRFRVIDYKSSEKKPPGKRRDEDPLFRGGEALQLPVYLLAAPALLDAPVSAAGEARYLYLVLSTGEVRVVAISSEDLAARRADFETILETIASGIETGFFPAFPNGGKNCERCDYTTICGPATSVTRLYERKAADAQFAPFHAMKAIGTAGGAGAADAGAADAADAEEENA